MLPPNTSTNVAEQLGLDPSPLTSPISVDTGYDMTKDPFATVSFILLVFTIVASLFILVVTARRSANDIWDLIQREREQRQRMRDPEGFSEASAPLIGSDNTEGSTATKGRKAVRFSEKFDFVMIPTLHPFDSFYEGLRSQDARGNNSERKKTRSISEVKLAELHLG